jgi:hypothetical protein
MSEEQAQTQEEKKVYFITEKKLTDDIFEYLSNKTLKETIHLVNALRGVQTFGDEGYILTRDLTTTLLNYLLEQKARETINFIIGLNRSKQFIPPAPPTPNTVITDDDETSAQEGRQPQDEDVELVQYEPENEETKSEEPKEEKSE